MLEIPFIFSGNSWASRVAFPPFFLWWQYQSCFPSATFKAELKQLICWGVVSEFQPKITSNGHFPSHYPTLLRQKRMKRGRKDVWLNSGFQKRFLGALYWSNVRTACHSCSRWPQSSRHMSNTPKIMTKKAFNSRKKNKKQIQYTNTQYISLIRALTQLCQCQ